MKFLYMGDVHESDDIPSSRKDDFEQTKINKINEIKDLANKYNVEAILEGGDFLSKPSPKSEFISKLLGRWLNCDLSEVMFELLKLRNNKQSDNIINKIKDCTPLIGVVGNHELYGNNLRTLPKTMIKFLNDIGFLQFATKENPIIFKTDDGMTIAITGTHYHNGMDKPENINDYVVEEKLGDIHIHIVHGMLVNKSVGDLYRHTTIDEVAKLTKADLTISGHDHLGFPLTEIDGKYFVNPGSPFRTSASLKEIKRKPKVLLIDISKKNGLKVKSIYLKSAEDGEKVLDRSKIEEQIKRKQKLEDIKSVVEKVDLEKGFDIKTIIENIAENSNIDENIKNDVVDEITKKMEEMDSSDKIICDDYYIKEITLKNFQSHFDTTITLDKGLNVFIGQSRQGKTSILRALDFVIENRCKRNVRRYISTGADKCEVTLKLSNGYVITRVVERKVNGRNGYIIFNPNTGETEELNTKGLKIVQELLGFSNLNIDKDLSIPLNFLRQGDSWFLIGDKYTAPQREKIIGGIYGTHYADAVIRKYDRKEKSIYGTIKNKNEDKLKLEEELNKYSDLENLEAVLNKINLKKQQIEVLQIEIDEIKAIKEKQIDCTNKIDEIDKILNSICDLDNTNDKFKLIKEKHLELNNIKDINKKRLNIIEKGIGTKNILDRLNKLEYMKSEMLRLKNLNTEKEELDRDLKEFNKTLSNVRKIENDIFKANNIIMMMDNLNKISEKIKELKDLDIELRDYQKNTNEVLILSDKKEKLNFELENIDIVLEKTKNIDNLKLQLKGAKDNELELEKAIDINNKRKTIIHDGKKINEDIKRIECNMNIEINKYKGILLKENRCPLCNHTISEEIIDRVIKRFI